MDCSIVMAYASYALTAIPLELVDPIDFYPLNHWKEYYEWDLKIEEPRLCLNKAYQIEMKIMFVLALRLKVIRLGYLVGLLVT